MTRMSAPSRAVTLGSRKHAAPVGQRTAGAAELKDDLEALLLVDVRAAVGAPDEAGELPRHLRLLLSGVERQEARGVPAIRRQPQRANREGLRRAADARQLAALRREPRERRAVDEVEGDRRPHDHGALGVDAVAAQDQGVEDRHDDEPAERGEAEAQHRRQRPQPRPQQLGQRRAELGTNGGHRLRSLGPPLQGPGSPPLTTCSVALPPPAVVTG